jgi:hypothetical protein
MSDSVLEATKVTAATVVAAATGEVAAPAETMSVCNIVCHAEEMCVANATDLDRVMQLRHAVVLFDVCQKNKRKKMEKLAKRQAGKADRKQAEKARKKARKRAEHDTLNALKAAGKSARQPTASNFVCFFSLNLSTLFDDSSSL